MLESMKMVPDIITSCTDVPVSDQVKRDEVVTLFVDKDFGEASATVCHKDITLKTLSPIKSCG